jgi:hypothetical protein
MSASNETPTRLMLELILLAAGYVSLRTGLRLAWSRGTDIEDVWRRFMKIGAIVAGVGGLIAGATGLLYWLLRRS